MRGIYLVGFMAAGKTSVGRELARSLGVSFVDLDAVIADGAGVSVPEIFARDGEAVFRLAEREALRRTTRLGPAVVATGAGVFCSAENRRLIRASGGVSVFLDVGWDVILRRLPGDNTDRPKFGSADSARRLFEKREPEYRKAEVTVALTGDESPAEVAAQIVEVLSGARCAT
jgi:shikimate kinase